MKIFIMIPRLFSVFDPACFYSYQLNWISLFCGLIIIPLRYWLVSNRITKFTNLVIRVITKEFTLLLGPSSINLVYISLLLFVSILLNNVVGILPHTFTATTHISFCFRTAWPLWLSLIVYGWVNNTQHILAHIVPKGTPSALIVFIVLIERLRVLIRPLTLAIRLTANIIAGHLLLALIGGIFTFLNIPSILGLLATQTLLIVLECAVSVIQAYVFAVLITLYANERID